MNNVIKFPIKKKQSIVRPSAEDFGDRIQNIRSSLEKINTLMVELKNQNKKRRDSD